MIKLKRKANGFLCEELIIIEIWLIYRMEVNAVIVTIPSHSGDKSCSDRVFAFI